NYYNPLKLPGSTELIFQSEISQLLELIRTTKYPIICDVHYYWSCMDTLVQTLSDYTTVQKSLLNDFTLVLLKPGKRPVPKRLTADSITLYYNGLGAFGKYLNQTSTVRFPDHFTIEFYGRL